MHGTGLMYACSHSVNSERDANEIDDNVRSMNSSYSGRSHSSGIKSKNVVVTLFPRVSK